MSGDIGLGLVVVVVGDEVLDRVLGEELLELAVELGGQGLVVGDDQGRALDALDDIGDREGLAGACGAEEHLALEPLLDARGELVDGDGLIAGRLIRRVESEVHGASDAARGCA